jgi:hypothetical protein
MVGKGALQAASHRRSVSTAGGRRLGETWADQGTRWAVATWLRMGHVFVCTRGHLSGGYRRPGSLIGRGVGLPGSTWDLQPVSPLDTGSSPSSTSRPQAKSVSRPYHDGSTLPLSLAIVDIWEVCNRFNSG